MISVMLFSIVVYDDRVNERCFMLREVVFIFVWFGKLKIFSKFNI